MGWFSKKSNEEIKFVIHTTNDREFEYIFNLVHNDLKNRPNPTYLISEYRWRMELYTKMGLQIRKMKWDKNGVIKDGLV